MIATHFKVWSHNNALSPYPTQPYPSTAYYALLCQMCNSATIFSVYHISNIYWSFNKGLYINYSFYSGYGNCCLMLFCYTPPGTGEKNMKWLEMQFKDNFFFINVTVWLWRDIFSEYLMVFACVVVYVQPLMLSIAHFKDCSFHFALSEYYCQWHFQISPCVQFYHQLNSIPFGIWLLFCFHLQLTFK